MTCAWYDLGCTAVTIANGVTGSAATSATSSAATAVWDVMGTAFADGAAALLKSFADLFAGVPDLDLGRRGSRARTRSAS